MASIDTSSTPPPGRGRKTAPARSPSLSGQRADALEGLGSLFAVPLVAFRLYADAGAVGMYLPGIATETAKLADKEEKIARLVDPLLSIGPYAGLIAAVLPLVLQLGVNHGRVAPGAMGTVPATLLEAQVKTELAKAELAQLKAQREAEQAAQAMRDEIEEQKAKIQADK